MCGNTLAVEVNIYSARKEALIKPLLDRFTAATGVSVNLVTGKADALLKRL
ncbi:MAG: Fe(3+) ABC transporter substrate-binding protein, partial [Chromatiales bacterium]|nr:Fe(3+) ABC transporter substrate-binding protein [Chromatiales bacterium]